MNKCLYCEKEFEPKRNSTGKYCSRSCGAKVNNRLYPKRYNAEKNRNCLKCSKDLNYSQISFCSKYCAGSYKRKVLVDKWLKGEDSGGDKKGILRDCFRNYLLEESNYKCSVESCRWGVPNPVTGKPILSVDHIDGDWTNNKRNNLKVLCYNCHTLTATFGSLNKNGLFKDREGTFRHGKTDNTIG